jgi:hypothetical protein
MKQTQDSDDPKKRLNDYISESFSIKSKADRPRLLEYLDGEAKARLNVWSDDQFEQAFIQKKREFQKLTFQQVKSLSPVETSITYEIVYLDHDKQPDGKSRDSKITNKKLGQMTKKDGKWYITSVKNIAELIEYQNEMSLP